MFNDAFITNLTLYLCLNVYKHYLQSRINVGLVPQWLMLWTTECKARQILIESKVGCSLAQ